MKLEFELEKGFKKLWENTDIKQKADQTSGNIHL